MVKNEERTVWVPIRKDSKRLTASPGFTMLGTTRWRPAGGYDRNGVELTYTDGHYREYPPGWEGGYWDLSGVDNGGYNPNDWSYPTPDTSAMRNQSIVECINRLASQEAAIGQYLAESMKSAEMLAESYNQFLRLWLALRRGRLPDNWKLSASMANNVLLQSQYGWRPLVNDLYDMYRIAHEGVTTRPLIFHASRQIEERSSGTWNAVSGKPGTREVRSVVKTKLYAKVSGTLTGALNQIGLANPAQIAWELVPYSFVWDWAMPIGSFLRTLSASAGLDFLGGFTTTFKKGTYKTELLNVGSATAKTYDMLREPHGTLPTAFVDYWPYAKKLPVDPSKIAAMLQLLGQRL
nr:MAG: maturation protein [Sanya fiers-like virus 26]